MELQNQLINVITALITWFVLTSKNIAIYYGLFLVAISINLYRNPNVCIDLFEANFDHNGSGYFVNKIKNWYSTRKTMVKCSLDAVMPLWPIFVYKHLNFSCNPQSCTDLFQTNFVHNDIKHIFTWKNLRHHHLDHYFVR